MERTGWSLTHHLELQLSNTPFSRGYNSAAAPPLGCRDNDTLGLQVILQGLWPMLPADAAELHTTKRHFVIANVQGVDPHIAGLQTFGSPPGFTEIFRPHRRP